MPQASSAPRRGPSVTKPSTMSTIAARTHSSTSGNGAHGALGASDIRARWVGGAACGDAGARRVDPVDPVDRVDPVDPVDPRGAGGAAVGAGAPPRLRLRRPMGAKAYGVVPPRRPACRGG